MKQDMAVTPIDLPLGGVCNYSIQMSSSSLGKKTQRVLLVLDPKLLVVVFCLLYTCFWGQKISIHSANTKIRWNAQGWRPLPMVEWPCPEWSLASCLWQRQPTARGIAKRSPEPGKCSNLCCPLREPSTVFFTGNLFIQWYSFHFGNPFSQ